MWEAIKGIGVALTNKLTKKNAFKIFVLLIVVGLISWILYLYRPLPPEKDKIIIYPDGKYSVEQKSLGGSSGSGHLSFAIHHADLQINAVLISLKVLLGDLPFA